MSIDFRPAFASSKGGPIEHDGVVLYLAYWLPVAKGDRFSVSFLRCAKRPRQGLALGTRGKGTRLEINGVQSDMFVLWCDTAPPRVSVVVVKASPEGQLGFWNVWEDPRYGTLMYGLSSSAMRVSEREGGSIVLGCSDGSGDADFNDLVVQIEREPVG